MAENKTQKTGASVTAFIAAIEDETMRKDCKALVKLMEKASGAKAKMWGPAIVGFGDYHYKYESGREADWFLTGFSPRKQNLTLYIMCGFEHDKTLIKKLGKHKLGKSCLYIKKLEDIDSAVLEKLVSSGVMKMKKAFPQWKSAN